MLKLSREKAEISSSSEPLELEPELEPPHDPEELEPEELDDEPEDDPQPMETLDEESWPHEPPIAFSEVRGAKRPPRARLLKLPADMHSVLPKYRPPKEETEEPMLRSPQEPPNPPLDC